VTVDAAELAYASAVALFDELVAGGVRHVCLSPGSRSTPLALAAARDGRLEVHVHLDERSSGFFALGLAKTLQRPVAVVCTSGTAAAELLPAVVEASQSRIPLVLLTADRPPALRGTGANQTIDQVELFGRYARGYLEPPVPARPDHPSAWRDAGREAIRMSGAATPGPVQIDCPFDEPLVPREAIASEPPSDASLPHGARDASPVAPQDHEVEAVAAAISGRRGLVVLGPTGSTPPGSIGFLALRLGWPVVAEPASNLRRPGAALAAGQPLLGSTTWLDAHVPDVVLQVGAAPTTRATQRLVAESPSAIVLDAAHLDPDPFGLARLRVRADPDPFAEALADRSLEPAPASWLDDWRLADSAARRAMDDVLDRADTPTELQIARDVAAALPSAGTLFVGNSMPVRDLDHAMAPRDGIEVLANRGASGIDGLVSTALGIATGPRASGPGPTVALLGDLSVLHDVGALVWNARRAVHLVVVVVNNGGGQIFALLDQGGLPELLPLFVTPHAVDLGALCAAVGIPHARVDEAWAFDPALAHAIGAGGLQVLEAVVDADTSQAQRTHVHDAVETALAGLIG
jgi:2-succinyl-5-enolpyruvyl-6-hydroxy-3-cyclohexene-1-carboxylate synthase